MVQWDAYRVSLSQLNHDRVSQGIVEQVIHFEEFEEGRMDLRTLETNNPPTGGNYLVIFGLTVFFVGFFGSGGFFFKEKMEGK